MGESIRIRAGLLAAALAVAAAGVVVIGAGHLTGAPAGHAKHVMADTTWPTPPAAPVR